MSWNTFHPKLHKLSKLSRVNFDGERKTVKRETFTTWAMKNGPLASYLLKSYPTIWGLLNKPWYKDPVINQPGWLMESVRPVFFFRGGDRGRIEEGNEHRGTSED